MRRLSVFLFLLFTLPAVASKHAPLPPEVYSAKTVYIANQTGDQEALDIAYDRLNKWGRYTIVTEKSKADLIIQFSNDAHLAQGTNIGFTRMDVLIRGVDQPAFEATERWSKLQNGPKNCIEDFRKRVDK